ncbi:preprotein translocase subunit SecA [Rhodovibrio salinarum]|uniref:Protein translocase subunit SecA n=1 Tax=Rhodovibrio salinarum TaxID=1087 RepID=A0A934QHZ5_9PROT|nr:preprotein translocase subunit SecA [Rhodovibrio salinarum]MBK1697117.1 preprotein translocase subunit SecA [Rhodovibrio salinarum]
MIGALASKLFGTANDRFLKGLRKQVEQINKLEPELEKLSDTDLRARTDWFKERLSKGETLDDLLVEAFATVREAAKRTLGQRHFDVQLLGGIVLHKGMISEMKTGEGKTLVSTLAVYLNALAGHGAHVVTVNDYLAERDAEWMGSIYRFLGLSVDCIKNGLPDAERRNAYACDVTYGTNNEFGFDYLRDNMKFQLEEMVQRDFFFAIVDEVDSILIDEARTPLIISGPTENTSSLYISANELIPHLGADDYETDEKARAVNLTEDGVSKVEELARQRDLMGEGSLFDIDNVGLLHHVNQALRAHKLFQRDRDYIVKDGKVVIIDEFTGRMMEGRRFSEGLHQALEAKEGVAIQNENQTLASITFQNYFRLYPKLSGMTGTAMTEAGEFAEIYGLECAEVPTNKPMVRKDLDDVVYRTAKEKYDAIVERIRDCHERQQPVLVGTVSIDKSEQVSDLLKKANIPHKVLNARYHEQEAYIIGQAGAPGAVTIATNMAGRGTDIQLGGNPEMRVEQETQGLSEAEAAKKAEEIRKDCADNAEVVRQAGGLFVLGTERHESRRIDNQLRGRSGRQGDPGASQFFLSLEDDLMRIFGSERMDSMLGKLGLEEGEAITHRWVNKALEKAQSKVEGRNFEIRKNLLKFDDVMNDQRKVIYEQRRELMQTEDVSETVTEMRHQTIEDLVGKYVPEKAYPEQWELGTLGEECRRVLALDLPIQDWAHEEGIADQEIQDRIVRKSDEHMAEKAANYGPELMRHVEKQIVLHVVDKKWKEHLLNLDHLRHGIGLRAFAQRNPLHEYKQEAFEMFQTMLAAVREEVTFLLSHVELRAQDPEQATIQHEQPAMTESRGDAAMAEAAADASEPEMALAGVSGGAQPAAPASGGAAPQTVRHASGAQVDPNDPSTWGKVGRNQPCPCGSGQKYKHCHGKMQ